MHQFEHHRDQELIKHHQEQIKHHQEQIKHHQEQIKYHEEHTQITRNIRETKQKQSIHTKSCQEQLKNINTTCKGMRCSISGKQYEIQIWSILKHCWMRGSPFHTNTLQQLGGSTSSIDIQCNFLSNNDIGIEIKKCRTPDWMQCSIYFDEEKNRWFSSKSKCHNKHPIISDLFNKLLEGKTIFGNTTPFFLKEKITYSQWNHIKQNTDKWNDHHFHIPNDTIRNLYKEKGCHYIQISEYGLYHLGEDICDCSVPEFQIEQQMRVRVKVHSRENKKGFCRLSIMASCLPKNIKSLIKSDFSLDSREKLPKNIDYHE